MPEGTGPLEEKLALVPDQPGVYLMKDSGGEVIYVGKAVNLNRRLHHYFSPHPKGNRRVLSMISHIHNFEYIICANELEALVLENNLIKLHMPRYNVLLRDDKEYPYIKITLNEAYPRVLKSYHVEADQKQGVRYFGPYLSGDLSRALQAIYEIFPLKRCRRVLPRDIGKERPCLYYYIEKCIGPCLGSVPQARYREVINQLCDFLDGRSAPFRDRLAAAMQEASAALEYERAARIRDRLQALDKLQERQIIVNPDLKGEADVIALAKTAAERAIELMKVRQGRIVSAGSYFFPLQDDNPGELFRSFILQYYSRVEQWPREILVSHLPDSAETLQEWLSRQAGRKVDLKVPERGIKRRWLEMSETNAREALRRHTLLGGGVTDMQETLLNLQEVLGLTAYPRRIEAYDIANLGEADQAASMVVFVDGKPKRSAYRHFKIKGVAGQDDYAAMQEVIRRRLERWQDDDFAEPPQLILLDGGKQHVRAVQAVIPESREIDLAGMVKDDRHRSRGLITANLQEINLQPELEDSQDLSMAARNRQLALLRLITAIQNEAHRFAGRLQKKLGQKRNLRWSLEEIPGVGPARRRKLLSHFKSVKNIAAANLDDLKAVPGLPEATAQAVYIHFHPDLLKGSLNA